MGNVGHKTNRMNFLNSVFQGSTFFLASFLEIHCKGEGASNCAVDLRLECIKNNPNVVYEVHIYDKI